MERYQRIIKNEKFFSSFGQATLEYLIILAFLSVIAVKMVRSTGKFMNDNMGELAKVMSLYLTTGVCKENCYWSGYTNGFEN